MAERSATATWKGNLQDGQGSMSLGSGLYEGPFTFASRFESGEGTNPEELIGAAHAGCYSMFLSGILSKEGFTPNSIYTTATVHLGRVDGAPAITTIELDVDADVPGIDADKFMEYAETAKKGCPVSKALAGVDIQLNAMLA